MPQTRPEKIVGIIGGMGPEATVDLMQRIIRLTVAADDSDHIRCIVDNNPKVPSRIKAIIEGNGESPAPCLAEMARKLEAWGANFLVIPCNTAHHYYPDVQSVVRVPVVNLIELTARTIVAAVPGVRAVGLLASPAVRMTGLYEEHLTPQGIEIIYPGPIDQERLFACIKGVKAGVRSEDLKNTLREIASRIAAQGAEALIIACTELSALGELGLAQPTFDAAELLAREIVAMVKDGQQS